MSRSSTLAAMGTPWIWAITSYSRSSPPAAAAPAPARTPEAGAPPDTAGPTAGAGPLTPCQAGRKRANAWADVGST
jgi:hypothetical protein